MAEVDQTPRMKARIAQLPVQREVPPRMIAQQFHRLPIGHSVQILQQTNPQPQHRFKGRAPIIRAIALLQRGSRPRQLRVNQLGKQPVAVAFGKELGRQAGGGEQFGLSGEVGQAQNIPCAFKSSVPKARPRAFTSTSPSRWRPPWTSRGANKSNGNCPAARTCDSTDCTLPRPLLARKSSRSVFQRNPMNRYDPPRGRLEVANPQIENMETGGTADPSIAPRGSVFLACAPSKWLNNAQLCDTARAHLSSRLRLSSFSWSLPSSPCSLRCFCRPWLAPRRRAAKRVA